MNSRQLRLAAQRWLHKGVAGVVIEISQAQGSVPRSAGTRMLVSASDTVGTIGGGHLEWQAVGNARRSLLQGSPVPEPQRISLGPSLGQCCGGVVELRFDPLTAQSLGRWTEPRDRFHLHLYGAGHVGWSLARVLCEVDCTVDWIDVRPDAFPNPRQTPWADAPGLRMVCSDSPVADAQSALPGAHHMVMTHSHALDYDIVLALLSRPDTGLVGLIGSRTKRMRFEHRLLARGLSPERVAQLICPIGIQGLEGKEPSVVAIAVAAQLLALSPPAAMSECGFQPTGSGLSSSPGARAAPLGGGRF